MNLTEKLALIKTRFDIDAIIERRGTQEEVARYYSANKLAYRLFHSREGFIHMGISMNQSYADDDLLAQARYVGDIIESKHATSVLELAYGQGANSRYLARKYPQCAFRGIDLADGQAEAQSKDNLALEFGDYHNLSRFSDESFDVVFVIEALCHSLDKEKVLNEVYRVLRPDGAFVIIDAYRRKAEGELSQDEKTAVALVEKGMMVAKIEEYDSFMDTVERSHFEVVGSEDVTQYIVPTLRRFERQAFRYFKRGWLMRLINSLLPKEFTGNVVSGLLMPDMIERGIAIYTILTLRK